jgi:hypothetical protein
VSRLEPQNYHLEELERRHGKLVQRQPIEFPDNFAFVDEMKDGTVVVSFINPVARSGMLNYSLIQVGKNFEESVKGIIADALSRRDLRQNVSRDVNNVFGVVLNPSVETRNSFFEKDFADSLKRVSQLGYSNILTGSIVTVGGTDKLRTVDFYLRATKPETNDLFISTKIVCPQDREISFTFDDISDHLLNVINAL